MKQRNDRRSFLMKAVLAGTATMVCVEIPGEEKNPGKSSKREEEKVTPVEDLSREHGLLRRVLLIYDELIRRLTSGKEFDPILLASAAEIIRRFIEDYHEKLEEEYLFPRFAKAGILTDLVTVLQRQHKAGRNWTAQILQLAKKGRPENETVKKTVSDFVRMYRPHAAREDTILFPALRSVVSEREYNALGDEFEKKEHQLFGKEGFEGVLDQVVGLEKKLGVYDLNQFTSA